MLISLKLIVSLLGIVFPGYALARALKLQQKWIVAFPFSAFIMVELVIVFSLVKVPLTFGAMCIGLLVVTGLLLSWASYCSDPASPDLTGPDNRSLPRWLQISCLGVTLAIIAAVTFRATLYPLSGADTYFRWEALARLMLLQESLQFYPPVSAGDYAIYLIPDGIPPLVATVYWWVYAAFGKPLMELTSVSVFLQLASVMALTFYAALQIFGTRAAYFSLLALSTSTLLLNGFAIGQETGYTALSVAGQLCFAWAAVRNPKISTVLAAALFAAIGALARDYGPALAITGFLILAVNTPTRRYLPAFAVTVVVLAAPWYLRNWYLTGDPLFPRAMPGSLPINEVYVEMHNAFHATLSFYRYNLSQWIKHLGILSVGAPLAIFGGIPFGIARWRGSAILLIIAGFVTLLWLLSMGETAGGVEYSMRVLTPAFVVLAILAGAAAASLYGYKGRLGNGLRTISVAVAAACSVFAIANALAHPFSVRYLRAAVSYGYTGPPEICESMWLLARKLQSSKLPATGVLTDSAYLARFLQLETEFKPFLIWNPVVKFVFEPDGDVQEIQRLLIEKNIRVVALSNSSSNNSYLLRIPFYQNLRQGIVSGRFRLIAVQDEMGLFDLSSDK